MKKRFLKNKSGNITTAFLVVVMSFLVIACSEKDTNTISSFKDRAEVPILKTTDVVTMISDSGITRYRINAPLWAIYDKAEEPYWDFPEGIKFERFDREYKTDADIESDKAVFFEKQKLWELTGNVHATNLEGETFKSNKLFWNQDEERIYSDDSITITQADKIIYGKGFESDQTMSKYHIKNVSGIIPIKDVE